MRNPLHSVLKRLFRLRRTPVVARRLNRVFLLDPRNWIDNRLLAGAPYEVRQLKAAAAAIERNQCSLLVDIGANFGLYSIVLGGLRSVKTILAFEPVARNHAQLMANLFLNGMAGKADVRCLAIGNAAAAQTIHIDPKSTGVSRLNVVTAARAPEAFTETEIVHVVRFDDVVSIAGQSAFVKIDVEGGAVEALASMTRFLTANEVTLQIELAEPERAAARALLLGLGYNELPAIEGDFIFVGGAPLNSASMASKAQS